MALSSMHSNSLQTQSLLSNLASPANAIINPLDPTQGYGRLRHFSRMKREQFLRDAHEPLSVRWDEVDLSTIVDVLESCGNGSYKVQRQAFPGQQTNISPPITHAPIRENRFGDQQQQERRFDPRAPHFDVILVDLTNTMSDAAPSSVNQGVASSDHEIDGNALESRPKFSSIRSDISTLQMESLAGRPGWVFLWVGPTEGLVDGRRILGNWGFRKVECIGWMKTNGGWDRVVNPITTEDPTSNRTGILNNAVEWCIMGCKGSAKRTFDSHLIHCNANTDVIISDGPDAPISSLLSHIIENFSLGQRRLHLFARAGDERPGWVTVGRDMKETNFDCKRYMRTWGEFGRQGWLTSFDPEIEYFRPKTPPLQVRRRERANKCKNNRDNSGKGRFEAEPPRFPHFDQKKRATWRPMAPEMQRAYALYPHMDKTNILLSIDEGATTFNPSAQGRLLEHGTTQKQLMYPRVAQLSGSVSTYQRQQQHQNQRGSAQFQPSPLHQNPLPQEFIESKAPHTSPEQIQLHVQHPYLLAPFVPQQMRQQSHQPKPMTQGFCSISDGRPMNQTLRSMLSYSPPPPPPPPPTPVSIPSSPSINTSLSSNGQSGNTNNGNVSRPSESPSTSIYTYSQPTNTPPGFMPKLYRNTLAASPRMVNGTDNARSTPQQTGSWAGQTNVGGADPGRQLYLGPPGFGEPPIVLPPSCSGQTRRDDSSSQLQSSDKDHNINKPLLPRHLNVGYHSRQSQPGAFGGYKALGTPDTMTQTSGPRYNYPPSTSNNSHTHQRNWQQNSSPHPGAHWRRANSGTYAAPRIQDYVRGENGEFIVDKILHYQQPYLSGGNGHFRAEKRENKNVIQDPALLAQAQSLAGIPNRTQSYL